MAYGWFIYDVKTMVNLENVQVKNNVKKTMLN